MNKIDFDYVALTQALVKCPSITPHDEGALQVVEDYLKDLGFECTRLPFSDFGFNDIDNLFAKIVSRPYFVGLFMGSKNSNLLSDDDTR